MAEALKLLPTIKNIQLCERVTSLYKTTLRSEDVFKILENKKDLDKNFSEISKVFTCLEAINDSFYSVSAGKKFPSLDDHLIDTQLLKKFFNILLDPSNPSSERYRRLFQESLVSKGETLCSKHITIKNECYIINIYISFIIIFNQA